MGLRGERRLKFCYRIRDACLGTGPVFAPSMSRCFWELAGILWGFLQRYMAIVEDPMGRSIRTRGSEDKFDAGGLVERCI